MEDGVGPAGCALDRPGVAEVACDRLAALGPGDPIRCGRTSAYRPIVREEVGGDVAAHEPGRAGDERRAHLSLGRLLEPGAQR